MVSWLAAYREALCTRLLPPPYKPTATSVGIFIAARWAADLFLPVSFHLLVNLTAQPHLLSLLWQGTFPSLVFGQMVSHRHGLYIYGGYPATQLLNPAVGYPAFTGKQQFMVKLNPCTLQWEPVMSAGAPEGGWTRTHSFAKGADKHVWNGSINFAGRLGDVDA